MTGNSPYLGCWLRGWRESHKRSDSQHIRAAVSVLKLRDTHLEGSCRDQVSLTEFEMTLICGIYHVACGMPLAMTQVKTHVRSLDSGEGQRVWTVPGYVAGGEVVEPTGSVI